MVGGTSPSAMSMPPNGAGAAPDTTAGCAALVHAHRWDLTPLGPIDGWDPAVRATVELILASPVPMALTYGDDFTLVYNDAYAHVIGAKHPGALGRPAADVFSDAWEAPGVRTVLDDVFH